MPLALGPRRPTGAVIIDGQERADSHRCIHCGNVFFVVPGSGTTRGFCRLCMGITCGSPACDACMNFEKRLDLFERGKLTNL